MSADTIDTPAALPLPTEGRSGPDWWGVLCLIATEASLFAYLLFSYYYMVVQHGADWLPEAHPSIAMAGPNTVILLASSVAVWWGKKGVKAGGRGQHLTGLALAIGLGLVFLVVQYCEWKTKPYGLTTSAYGSLFFTITGFHMLHVVVGVMVLAMVLIWSIAGYFDARHYNHVTIAAAYWHFVDVVRLCVFATFYLSPYVMGTGS